MFFSTLCGHLFIVQVSSNSYGTSSGENHEKVTPEFFIGYVGNSSLSISLESE